ncbi:MAG: methionine--tRNA ligase subunit beta, partial [Planctomycetes bacterium]|nr:methionine--tRNA ligase subunit beta [Planctomycetota bacterium]
AAPPPARQVVAGIKPHYKPEDLVGKYCILLNNLAPRPLRGVESQGMVLAASDGAMVVILSPEKPLAPGSAVS